jgi:hypothetical protein
MKARPAACAASGEIRMAVGGVLAGGRAVGVGPSAGWFGAVVRRSVGWMMVWWLRGERVVWCCTAAAMVGGLVVLSEGSGGVRRC